MPCEEVKPLLHSSPGSSPGRGRTSRPVRVTPLGPTKSYTWVRVKRITPLPYFGIDRMGDFGWVGTANLWKSGPFFSTGISEAKLMVKGASIEPAVASDAMPGRLRGRNVGKDGMKLAPSCPQHLQSPALYLPQQQGPPSTAPDTLRLPPATPKEA
jgi:hypothetical protein